MQPRLLQRFKIKRRADRNFYATLPAFKDFRELKNPANFVRVPDDWFVVISDIKGSTKAIERGRYEDVNKVGAASISVIQELFQADFPYVFGGDGATLLVPPESIEAVIETLTGLRRLAREQFQLELRVGRVAISEVLGEGVAIEVAKHELFAGRCVAVIRGGGLTAAEHKIKSDEDNYCVATESESDLQLKGLSCRWRPVPTKSGRILSLLVAARGPEPARVYEEFLEEMDRIFSGRLDEANPINLDRMSYKSIGECITDERRYHAKPGTFAYLLRVIEIFLAVLVFKYGLNPLVINPRRYKTAMRLQSDHMKFDDMLRMIVDCTPYQALSLRDYLVRAQKRNEVFFGLHESSTALMTCYVQSVKDGRHIHFIDGGDGGYAMAAKQLKAQMAAAK